MLCYKRDDTFIRAEEPILTFGGFADYGLDTFYLRDVKVWLPSLFLQMLTVGLRCLEAACRGSTDSLQLHGPDWWPVCWLVTMEPGYRSPWSAA
jgi:hypothetical protein